MTKEELLNLLQSGQRIYGTLVVSTSPRWPEAVRNAGLDFVFIDTEHIPLDRHQLSWMCQTYAAVGLPPIVRIPSPNPVAACQVLDGGADGIIVPYVETTEQVRELAGAVKLRPLKGSLLQKTVQEPNRFPAKLADYLNKRNAGTLLIVNIESVPALENLDGILSVPGLDAVLIGPHDLSVSLGIPEQYRHERFNLTVRQIIKKARSRHIAVGFHFWDDVELEIEWIKAGANLIIHSSDYRSFANMVRTDLTHIRQSLGESLPMLDTKRTVQEV